MAEPGEREQRLLGGRLLGTAPVQDSVNSLGREVKGLVTALIAAKLGIAGSIRELGGRSRATGGMPQWNNQSQWGGWGTQNGGNFTVNGQIARNLGSMYPNAPGGTGPVALPQGGMGSAIAPWSLRTHQPMHAGAAVGNGGRWVLGGAIGASAATLGATARWGTNVGPSMMQSDLIGTARYNNGGVRGGVADAARFMESGMGAIGFGSQDRRLAAFTGMTQLGIAGNNGGLMSSMRGAGAINPTMSAQQLMGVQQTMSGAPMHNMLRMWGIQSIGSRGNARPMSAVTGDILSRFGVNRAMGGNQIQATFRDQNSRMAQSLRSWGLPQEMIDTIMNQGAAESRIMSQGGDVGQFRSLISQAGGTGGRAKAARRTLETQFDYETPTLQTGRQREAEANMRNLQALDGFREAVRTSNDALSAFNRVLGNIIDRAGPLGQAYGALGGASSVIGGATAGVAAGASHAAAWYAGSRMLRGKTAIPSPSTAVARIGSAAGGIGSRFGGLAKAGGRALGVAGMAAYAWGKRPWGPEGISLLGGGQGEDWRGDGLLSGLFGSGGQGPDRQAGKKTGQGGKSVKLVRPVRGPITSGFGPRVHPIRKTRSTHTGIDISAPSGTPIAAAADGTVRAVFPNHSIYGRQTILDHGNGLATMYGHQSSQSVRPGQTVRQGQRIGGVGTTGLSTGNHLHFEVWRNGTPVNPMPYLGEGGGMVGAGGNSLEGTSSDATSGPSQGSSASSLMTNSWGSINSADAVAMALAGGSGVSSSGVSSDNGASGDNAGISGGKSAPRAPGASGASATVKQMAASRGWTGAQWDALYQLVQKESGWNPGAANPTSSARGLFQKMTSIHGDIEGTVRGQARWGLNYIANRYGDPASAWSFHQKNNWYDKGAYNITDDQTARVHKGEMIIPARQAETIRQALLKEAVPHAATGQSSGGGINIEFGPGSVVFKVDGDVNERSGRQAARGFMRALEESDRLKRMGEGR